MEDKIEICFDKTYKVRAFDPEKFDHADGLQKECSAFTEKVTLFNEKISSLVNVLEQHAEKIDTKKLQAIGLRLAAGTEAEQRAKQQKTMQALITEKRAELDRLTSQYISLEKIEADQKASLEKINGSK